MGCLACSMGQMKAVQSLQAVIIQDIAQQQLRNILLRMQVDRSNILISQWQRETHGLLPSAKIQANCHSNKCCAEIWLANLPSLQRCESY